jgi:predicted  nucleic acid-binding Zn-ribbon protein
MANVRKYTEQIASAKKGKDVRAAIVSAINEVSDENNTYNQTKADIQAAQKSINADVTKNQQIQQAFNSNLQEAKEVQKDLTTKMNKGTTLAENLEKKNTTATSLDKSLGEKNTAATKTVQTLEGDITAAGQAERSLEADVTAAGEAKTKLDASIKTSGENITTMQNLVQNADQIKTGLETDLNNAQQASKDLKQNTAASVTKIETAGQTQIDLIKQNGGGVENALSNYFALRRNGKVFTTKIYKWETSTSPVGVKMNANENMVAEPSVGRTEGRDDYAQYGLFHHFTCNFSVDENGFNHVDALEGQIGFTKYGKVQVGEVTMSAWFGIEDTTEAVLYHYSDSQTELTPYPMKESINPDGTISPFMIHAKYAAGDIDGVPYSSKGLAPANGCQATQARNPVSYTGMITYMHKLGGHYCGTTSWDLFYRQLMMIIKYATTHSQSIMAGCTSYSNQNQNLVEETGVMRVVLTKAQAAGYVIGSYVSIGDVGSNTNRDRYFSYIHNKAYSVKVTKIEDVDDSNAAVYVDAPEAFDTTLTTWITTMPWHSGATDEVAGSDGSPNSNTNGKDPYKIQGIETCIGAYEVLGNVVMDIVTGADGNPARDVYVCEDASTLSSNIATVRANYKKAIAQVAYTAASWKYITEETTDPNLGIMIPTKVGGGSTTGFADGLYTDTGTSGQREWLALGGLTFGASAGLWFLGAHSGWSDTSWDFVSGVSPNGTRGEWQATA